MRLLVYVTKVKLTAGESCFYDFAKKVLKEFARETFCYFATFATLYDFQSVKNVFDLLLLLPVSFQSQNSVLIICGTL